jgi:hypothetical protein
MKLKSLSVIIEPPYHFYRGYMMGSRLFNKLARRLLTGIRVDSHQLCHDQILGRHTQKNN